VNFLYCWLEFEAAGQQTQGKLVVGEKKGSGVE